MKEPAHINVLYVYTSASLQSDSVQSKLVSQIEALNTVGVNCKGLFFSFDIETRQQLNDHITLYPVKKIRYKRFASRIRSLQVKTVLEYLETHTIDYDFVYFRYPFAGYNLWKISNVLRKKIFFEHLCIETKEIKLYSNENKFSIRPSVLLGYIEYLWLPLLKEKIWGPLIRRNANFGICNAQQIANTQTKIASGNYKTYVNGDAVNCSVFPVRSTKHLENELNMIFLKGASGLAVYNGLDRIMKGMSEYKGDKIIKLHILGKHTDYEAKLSETYNVREKVVIVPRLSGKDLDAYINEMHIGISALGVHRKGLQETTTIKSREYYARGLPFIYGHYDADIDKWEYLGYTKRFDADDSIIPMQDIISFSEKVYLNPEHSKEMNKIAVENMDFNVKAQQLKEILKQHLQ